jgi:Tfp pilus assembly protein PilP
MYAFISGGVDVGGSVTSNYHPPPLELREWIRQRNRNQYRLIPIQKKEEYRHENYQQSKATPVNIEVGHTKLLGSMIITF